MKRFAELLFAVLTVVSVLGQQLVWAKGGEIIKDEEMRREVAFILHGDKNASVTPEDLKTLRYLEVTVSEDSDLRWINYCESLTALHLVIEDAMCEDALKDIRVLDKLTDFSVVFDGIYGEEDYVIGYDTFSKENFAFITKPERITELTVNNLTIDNEFLQEFENLENLTICRLITNSKIDYLAFDDLQSVCFWYIPVYDLAMEITGEDIAAMEERGIQVELEGVSDGSYAEEWEKIDRAVYNIIEAENFDDYITEEERFDAVCGYVLDEFEYDEQVSENLNNNITDNEYVSSFYEDGWLYAAFEMDAQICGNYAALLYALGNRLGLEVYFIESNTHAWNAVNLNGGYYYTDLTWVDTGDDVIYYKGSGYTPSELINAHKGEAVEYYLFGPSECFYVAHKAINDPPWIEYEGGPNIVWEIMDGIIGNMENIVIYTIIGIAVIFVIAVIGIVVLIALTVVIAFAISSKKRKGLSQVTVTKPRDSYESDGQTFL